MLLLLLLLYIKYILKFNHIKATPPCPQSQSLHRSNRIAHTPRGLSVHLKYQPAAAKIFCRFRNGP